MKEKYFKENIEKIVKVSKTIKEVLQKINGKANCGRIAGELIKLKKSKKKKSKNRFKKGEI